MLVRSDRRWAFPVTSTSLWQQITAVDHYRSWWPWLQRFDADGFAAGQSWTCVVQPPLPYSLRFTIVLDQVEPSHLVSASVAGDIMGDARLEIADTTAGCEARLVSLLMPGKRLMRAVTSVARPMVRFGHDWVLDTGARQFASRLPSA